MKKHLNICIQIEETVGRIYRKMATSERITPRVRQALQVLANDEDDHASQLRFAGRFPENSLVTSPPKADQRAQELLTQAKHILAKIDQIEVDDQQAISIGVELEKKFSEVHIANSFEFKEQSLKEMFAAMARGDDEHCQRLLELQQELLSS